MKHQTRETNTHQRFPTPTLNPHPRSPRSKGPHQLKTGQAGIRDPDDRSLQGKYGEDNFGVTGCVGPTSKFKRMGIREKKSFWERNPDSNWSPASAENSSALTS